MQFHKLWMGIAVGAAACVAVLVAPAWAGGQSELPKGWGGSPGDYEVKADRKVFRGGKASGTIRSTADDPKFGTLVQAFKADDYRGKRLRLTGYIKSENLSDWAGLWMRIDGEGKTLTFDNMNDRAVKGTKDWTKCELVLDVPEGALYITFGALLSGKGQIWVDDLKFETVGKDVKSTNQLEKELENDVQKFDAPAKPANLEFEDE